MTSPDYLTEAGSILMAAAQSNLKRDEEMRHLNEHHPARQEIRAEALRIADGLTRLAAIERNLPPCFGHPDAGQEAP